MKKTIIFIIMILAFASISYAANNCYVAEDCGSDVWVLDIARTTFLGFDVGSHAAWSGHSPGWSYKLCCPSTIGNVDYRVSNIDGAPENDADNDKLLFSLARNDGGHVQIRDWAYYHDPDYVNPDDKEHTKYHIYAVYSDNWYNCRVAEDSDCNSDENCVFKISNPSSGHIADCSSSVSYHYKYCCQERCKQPDNPDSYCSTDADCCDTENNYCSTKDENGNDIGSSNYHCCPKGQYWDVANSKCVKGPQNCYDSSQSYSDKCWYLEYTPEWFSSNTCTPHGDKRESCCTIDWYGKQSYKYVHILRYDPAADTDWTP